jgi:predicted N-acetyltransferase YhbS
MAIQYRAVRKAEEPEAMRLWTTVFAPTPEWYFQSELDAETTRKPHQTLVAVDGGKMVAAVQYFIRKTRALDGSIKKMGGIANVATLEEARKQGHSGKLLEMAVEKMTKDRCEWSMLFTGVNHHYERYGWKTVKTRYREGALADRAEHDDRWTVLPIVPGDEKDWWKPFVKIYDAFNAKRALTHARSQTNWEKSVLPRLDSGGNLAYLAWPPECREAAGYVVARTDDKKLYLQEVGVLPGSEEALAPMMDVVRELAVHRELDKVVAHVPFEPAVNAALLRLMKAPKIGNYAHVMVRSLSEAFPQEEVEKPFALDGPHFWPLDDF